MKAQGLPINFIVLAALAILILILAAGFVIGGGTSASGALSPQIVKNNCQNACVQLNSWAAGTANKTVPTGGTYCLNYTITGVSTPQKCDSASIGAPCVLTFQDGSNCKVGCNGAALTCP